MGWVLMGEREPNRIGILSKVLDRRMTTAEASGLLAIGPRQLQSLLRRSREDGAAGTRHGLRHPTHPVSDFDNIRSGVPAPASPVPTALAAGRGWLNFARQATLQLGDNVRAPA